MNNVILQGRLTGDIELKNTQSGKTVASFSLAVQRDKDNADFLPCVAWEKTAMFIRDYFRKGDGILIEGRLQSRKWEDKDGKSRIAYDVIVERVEFPLTRKEAKQETKAATAEELYDEAELPF